jgi:hypothetical protein
MGTKSGSKKGASSGTTSTSKVKEEEMPRKKSPQPWRRSESPVEDWEDVSENEWGFDIVGEEVDYWGDVRYATHLSIRFRTLISATSKL